MIENSEDERDWYIFVAPEPFLQSSESWWGNADPSLYIWGSFRHNWTKQGKLLYPRFYRQFGVIWISVDINWLDWMQWSQKKVYLVLF